MIKDVSEENPFLQEKLWASKHEKFLDFKKFRGLFLVNDNPYFFDFKYFKIHKINDYREGRTLHMFMMCWPIDK